MMSKLSVALGAGLMVATGFVATAQAGDLFGRDRGMSIKDAPAPAGRQFEWSANIGVTSDYVFRGFSQTLEDPALQGGFDMSYGIFYAGVWASGVDFVEGNPPPNSGDASIEVDLYAGITPKLGPVDFDLGVIYYAYPGAQKAGTADQDYVELKIGASTSFQKLTPSITYFYSPDYYAETGPAHIVEGGLAYELPQVWVFTPTVNGLVGGVFLDDDPDSDYTYWNAGLALAVENFTFDFRYWDTDTDSDLADERFVFTATVGIP